MNSMKSVHMVACMLLWIGGLNWGLVGLFNFNLVEAIFGSWPMVVTLIYVLVGASAVYVAATHMSDCKICSKK
jgi:uncharacterized membrane protein YuzA (DUF378 family)